MIWEAILSQMLTMIYQSVTFADFAVTTTNSAFFIKPFYACINIVPYSGEKYKLHVLENTA
jgi:hypothetical protein